MIVNRVGSSNPYLNVISVNDILVAVNGISFSSFPESLSKQDWYARLNSVSYPRLFCFFHCDPNGSDVFIPSKVFVFVAFDHRYFTDSLLFIEDVFTVLRRRTILLSSQSLVSNVALYGVFQSLGSAMSSNTKFPMTEENTINDYSRTTPYQLYQMPMLVQSFSPLNLSLSLSQTLQRYSRIVDDMTNQRVFTEHATGVLSQMLKNAECDLSTNYVSAINTMLSIGNNIYDCGNTYIGRLKEKKTLLSQQQGDHADIISTIDLVHNTLVDLLSQTRSLDMSLNELLQMLTQPSIPIQSAQVQQMTSMTDLPLPVGVMPLQTIAGYHSGSANQACLQLVAPMQSMVGNHYLMSQQILVPRTVTPNTTENVNPASYHSGASPSQKVMVTLNQPRHLSSSAPSIQPSIQPPPAPSVDRSSTLKQSASAAGKSKRMDTNKKAVRSELGPMNCSKQGILPFECSVVACLQSRLLRSNPPCLLPARFSRNQQPPNHQESEKNRLRKWNLLPSLSPPLCQRVLEKRVIIF